MTRPVQYRSKKLQSHTAVRVIQKRQGVEISAPEEIAYKNGWISRDELLDSAAKYGKSSYGQHLKNVAEGKLKD